MGEVCWPMAGERELIAAIRKRASQLPRNRGIVSLGIGDDCAVLRPRRGEEIVVTTDLSLENVHFRRDWHPPQSVGHRCLARGLSDLAAMGARPEAAFLSLALPAELTGKWMEGFFRRIDGAGGAFSSVLGRWRLGKVVARDRGHYFAGKCPHRESLVAVRRSCWRHYLCHWSLGWRGG